MPTTAQKLFQLLEITPSQESWDANINANMDILVDAIRTIKLTLLTQGGVGTPSIVQAQLQNSKGVDIAKEYFLKVRLCIDPLYARASSGSLYPNGDTQVIEAIDATDNRELVFKSDASGLIEFQVINATPSTMLVRVGPPDFSQEFGDYSSTLQVIHG